MSEAGWMALIFAGSVIGAACLRRSWLARSGDGALWKTAGWTALALCMAGSIAVFGSARGAFTALTLAGLAALAVVASGYELRAAHAGRSRSLAPEPVERPSTWWRGGLRWLLALPIGMVAAMGTGIFYSAWAGGAEQTRLVVGGMISSVVWGACMAWTLADNRILRALAFLLSVIGVSFGLAIVKGF